MPRAGARALAGPLRIDSAGRMSSHGTVHGLMDRLAATILVALLAGPSVAPCQSGLARERDASSSEEAGMNAPPGPTASVVLSVAPAALAAPLSATARVVVSFDPVTCARPTVRVLRPAMAVKSAPTILRI
jgi:hypothetical protein